MESVKSFKIQNRKLIKFTLLTDTLYSTVLLMVSNDNDGVKFNYKPNQYNYTI